MSMALGVSALLAWRNVPGAFYSYLLYTPGIEHGTRSLHKTALHSTAQLKLANTGTGWKRSEQYQ